MTRARDGDSDATETAADVAIIGAAADALAYLVVRQGERARIVDLAGGDEITLGRAAEAIVQIDDKRVSRDHARIRRRGADITLEDLGSHNGTRVNGRT